MNPNRTFLPPTGYPSSIPLVLQQQQQQQWQQQQAYQPVFVIPISTSPPSLEPIIVDLSNNTQPSVPPIAPKLDAPISSFSGAAKGKRSLSPLDDREMRRKVKKQNMERRRRACISDKLSALHGLAVSLVGEKPRQRSRQRMEITDILNQCVNVLERLSELVKSEPELQLKLRGLKIPLAKESSEKQRQGRQNSTSMLKEKVIKEEKENESPHASAFTPVRRHRMAATSTPLAAPLLLSTSPRQQLKCPLVTGCRKRESTDSGLNCLAPPSAEATAAPASFTTPSTSTSSHSLLEETQLLKRPRKSSLSDIWRPYRD
ncbi:unnamed protein product [Taenia asiatica]|uniref:BHLH domain-containing protein n=1 Tax=Taenia asiatica TaxID=60517 RepID=A0A0R3WBK9_TAEAS|nr:unnamed protein product [Taenia asiatica]